MILKRENEVIDSASPSESQKCLPTIPVPQAPLRYLMRLPESILYDGTEYSGKTTSGPSSPEVPSSSAVASFIGLPKELLAIIFDHVDVQDRYTFALSCKAAARYCTADPLFLALSVPRASATKPKVKGWWKTVSSPHPIATSNSSISSSTSGLTSTSSMLHSLKTWGNGNSYYSYYYDSNDVLTLSRTTIFRDLMQLLSKGWVGAGRHWCDQCRKFRHFEPETRRLWYADADADCVSEEDDVDGSRKAHAAVPDAEMGRWVQELGLSVDGLVCWNHWCPACSLKRGRGSR